MAVETSNYGQGNRYSGSIGVYFCFCRDECLRLWADLERLNDSGSDFGSDSGSDSDSNSGDNSDSDSGSNSDSDSGSNSDSDSDSDSGGNFLLNHQFQ